jgi:peptidoglycan/LPS O-acetylase OafA/YrhL
MKTPVSYPAIPSLDGFRALSISIVALSHAGFGDIVPGGLGVTIFFFLSGYLISTLLLQEYAGAGRINIRHFYLRRILRLYPPLLVTLAVAYVLVYAGKLGGQMSFAGLAAQLFYFANFYQLYFAGGHSVPDGTGILWSLAIEEHFYLVYPLVFLGLVRLRSRRIAVGLLALGCVIALSWRWHLVSQPSFDASRTYYATDTRFDSILFGCMLAFLRQESWRETPRSHMNFAQWCLLGAGFAGIAVSLLYRNEAFRESFRYTLQGVSLMPIFHYAIAHARNIAFKPLNLAPVRRIGVYSYSIYLIHFVLFQAITENTRTVIPPVLLLGVGFSLACGYAYLIDTYVDAYFRMLRKRLH